MELSTYGRALLESDPLVTMIGINHVTLELPDPSERFILFVQMVVWGYILSTFLFHPDGSLGTFYYYFVQISVWDILCYLYLIYILFSLIV